MNLTKAIADTEKLKTLYTCELFRLSEPEDRIAFDKLIASGEVLFAHDELRNQLKELIKCKHPSRVIADSEMEDLMAHHLGDTDELEYGTWAFYPWSKTLVHVLDESEFVQVRTNRNQNKITREEQQYLSSKTIAIIGLSVGQSIALTIATERICGTIRLADFDDLELSNLNRIRAGVKSLGLSKVVIAAREIAELDPYLHVEIYPQGITGENIHGFLTHDRKVDILVEVCDGLDMKVRCRHAARALNIPVVMDTNDRGMLDIERFDLNGAAPLLHGLMEGVDAEQLGSLSGEEKMQLIMKIVGIETISEKLRKSIPELQKTINALPQLASSVVLGGAITTDTCRRILLNELTVSGRFFIDLEALIS